MIWMPRLRHQPRLVRPSAEGRAVYQYAAGAVVEPESGLREVVLGSAIPAPDQYPADVQAPDVLTGRCHLCRGKRNVMRGVVVLGMDQVRVEGVRADPGEGGGRYP